MNNIIQKNKNSIIGRSRGDIIFDAITFIILTIIFIIVAYPLYFVVISSFSNPNAVASGDVILYPVGINFDGYKKVFENKKVITGFINSIIYTICGVILDLSVTIPTAYALSRKDFYGQKFVMIYYLITMFVNGGMIPTYLVVKNCGLLNTMWAVILPGSMNVYNMIVAKTFFRSNLPNELLEAAKLDGCSNVKFFFSIAIPLSNALIAVMVLFFGVGQWNEYFNALLYFSDEKKFPLQLVLRSILIQNSMQLVTKNNLSGEAMKAIEKQRQTVELMKYSLIIISSIPVLVIYPFVQKHFVKGVMIGSVKG